MLTDQQVFKQS